MSDQASDAVCCCYFVKYQIWFLGDLFRFVSERTIKHTLRDEMTVFLSLAADRTSASLRVFSSCYKNVIFSVFSDFFVEWFHLSTMRLIHIRLKKSIEFMVRYILHFISSTQLMQICSRGYWS